MLSVEQKFRQLSKYFHYSHNYLKKPYLINTLWNSTFSISWLLSALIDLFTIILCKKFLNALYNFFDSSYSLKRKYFIAFLLSQQERGRASTKLYVVSDCFCATTRVEFLQQRPCSSQKPKIFTI